MRDISFTLFLILLTLSGLISSFATHLRGFEEKSVLSSHLDDDEIFRIPLKKRVNTVSRLNDFQQFVSLQQRSFGDLEDSLYSKLYNDYVMKELETTENTNNSIQRIGLSRYHNNQFTGLISVGDSSNEFEVVFDTGKYLIFLMPECD